MTEFPTRSAPRRWAADLALGVRLSVAGGRAGWARLTMIAVGVGLGVAMLLVTATVPTLVAARSTRLAERAEPVSAEQTVARGDTTVLVAVANTDYRDRRIQGRLLQAEGTRPVLPPGVTTMPRAGEMIVSPALAALMASADGALLRDRWRARVAGEIGPAGLAGPGELVVYLGTDRLTEETAHRADRFGRPELDEGMDPTLILLGIMGLAALLVPVGVFVATAVRFGGETRDRRLAAVRLVGADTGMTRRIAAGETLTAALLGLLVGALFYIVTVLVAGRFVPAGMSFYAADARPVPALAILAAVLVPVSAVLVTLSALRKVVVEPLGVVRLSADRHRRLWWRLVLPVLGLALLWPIYDGFGEGDNGAGTAAQVLAGLAALLVGVALLLPWWVDATVRRLGGGSVAWELAVRRLQLDSGTAVRAVSGIAVSVAGAIALQGLLVAVQAQYTHETGRSVDDFQATVWPMDNDTARWEPALRGSPGVAALSTETTVWATTAGTEALIQIGDCTVLRQFARLDTCTDGDAFVSAGAAPGTRYDLGSPDAQWTLPATATAVTPIPDAMGAAPAAVLLTPGALGGVQPSSANVEYYVALTEPAAIDLLRNTVTGVDPTAGVSLIQDRTFESILVGIRQALLVLATALLLLIGASMVVTVAEQLHERRRLLAILTAFGTRRATLTGSVLYQVAIPVLLGMSLAILTGAALGIILQRAADAPISLDWTGMAITTGAAVLVILLATTASLPLLYRLTTPSALRTE
ncbi:ABC transporter permease [Catenuloplanes japonicus]|uniref:ABC transporter permease n=1 Tax=Catenuloplanes japonicus TaxID=33876 RepID=UPI000526022F|nr:ABC transporter permease [Catenuloplanes japonicus]